MRWRKQGGSRPVSHIYDLAIDFREDPPYLTYDDAKRIRDICVSMGAEAISSIHVTRGLGTMIS